MKKWYKAIGLFIFCGFFLLSCGGLPKNLIAKVAVVYKENGRLTPNSYGVEYQTLSIDRDEQSITLNYVEVDDPKASILIFHGVGESISEWAKTQVILGEIGYSSMVIDYTGFSRSKKKPGYSELKYNALEAYKLFNKITPMDRERIVLCHSMGNYIFLEIENMISKKPDKIIMHAPPPGIKDAVVYYEVLPKSLSFLVGNDFWNLKKSIPNIQSDHILIHSRDDEVTGVGVSEDYSTLLNEYGRFIILEGYRHNDLYKHPENGVWGELLKLYL